ncbi:hypothetical protein C8Q74DRAFT_1215787 [Fomes fomentarius]|nr:hypothetical protein C8Q74DRAFT_1215787 [Fomes fomentarius]
MSSDTASSIIADAAESAVADYCGLAGIVFLLYEYSITFGMEVDLFWTRRFSGATVLFLANKYITLLNHLFDLSLFIPFHVSDKTYNLKKLLHQMRLTCEGVLVSRLLAICTLGRNWFLSLSISLLSLVPLGVNFSVKIYGVNDPAAGCGMGEISTPALDINLTANLSGVRVHCTGTAAQALTSKLVVIISRTCLIAADVLLIFVTWYYLPRRGIARTFGRGARTFVDVFLLDGTIYFSVTAVLMSRFLLHLQKMNQDQRSVNLNADASDREHEANISTKFAERSVVFARVIGSIGTMHSADLSTISSPRSLEGSIEMEALGRVPARGDP